MKGQVSRASKSSQQTIPGAAADQLSCFIAKFDPAMAKLIRECRVAMRKRFPNANELVYDNCNFFVIGHGPSERPSCLACYTKPAVKIRAHNTKHEIS